MANNVNVRRFSPNYAAARIELTATADDYNVNTNHSLFKSGFKGASSNFDADKGYGDGTRFNIRIKPETNAIWVKFNTTDNDRIYIAGDEAFEWYNIETSNLFITSAAETTAQIDQVIAAAESSGNYEVGGIGTYFKLFATDATTGVDTTYGVWFDTDDGSTRPTDNDVDTWVEVDIATSDTADTIGGAIATAVDALTPFGASNTTGTVTITHADSGARKDAEDVDTPTTITTETEGAGSATTVNILVT